MSEKKSLKKKFDQFLSKNGLRYFSENSEAYSVTLPYSFNEKNVKRLDIRVSIYENYLLKISFSKELKASSEIQLQEVRKELLDINTKLMLGALAVESETNQVKFSIDYLVKDDDEISFGTYSKYIMFCLTLYADLIEKGILKDE